MKSFWKHYGLLTAMLLAIVFGCIVGAFWPQATLLKPLGTVFINLMFCLVVPMVFASIAGSVANMGSRKKAGKIMGVTIGTFIVTSIISTLIMYLLMLVFPPVTKPWSGLPELEVGQQASLSELVVSFFTAEDFVSLLSRRAMLPLIVFSLLFGFAVNLSGGADSAVGKWLANLSEVMLKFVKIITYYSPIAFFGFFADLVATYGPQITADYGRAMLAYYPLCVLYILAVYPLYALFGGGRQGPKQMFRHLLRPAMVSLGTCSSVATIPTNMAATERNGISKEVSDLVLPMGATMHMDGSCFSCVLKIAFMYGVFGRDFGVDILLPVMVVSVLSSMSMSGVPGGGYIGEYIICSLFFPDQMAMALPILITIGNLTDPPATMVNATGDYVATFIVERFVSGKDWLQKKLASKKDPSIE
jgi:Na+/H+-dicarboxylate symporter